MFKRDHHVRIATVLQSLNSEILCQSQCLFGGGTAIVLTHGEYRESVDIDFLVSDLDGYRELRQKIKNANDLSPIARDGFSMDLSREIRADQYGIRTMIDLGGLSIKFEIVYEGRISFESPASKDQICGISTLTGLDMAASKLLANSDRWADDSVFSRDIIDLAMLGPTPAILKRAYQKASQAYGDSVKRDIEKAKQNLKSRPGRLNECLSALKMSSTPGALLWEKIRKL